MLHSSVTTKRSRLARLLWVFLLGTIAIPSSAQTPAAPWRAVFNASADHAVIEHQAPLVSRYELLVQPQAGGTTTTVNLGKPTPNAQGVIDVEIQAAIAALPVGSYVARVQAVGPGGSTPSPVSDPFALTVRAPGAPGKPGASRAGS